MRKSETPVELSNHRSDDWIIYADGSDGKVYCLVTELWIEWCQSRIKLADNYDKDAPVEWNPSQKAARIRVVARALRTPVKQWRSVDPM